MEGSCSTGQSPQWAVVPMEEEEDEERKKERKKEEDNQSGRTMALGSTQIPTEMNIKGIS
jgi:hypothetical protein